MPALPWVTRQPLEPDRIYVVISSKLPLQRSRSISGFMRDTLAIRKQLSSATGLVGYTLDADLAHRTFWTSSIWTDQASLDTFAASEPHRHIIKQLRPLMLPTPFSTTTTTGADVPTTWSERKAPVL